jgi:hypothetical protein
MSRAVIASLFVSLAPVSFDAADTSTWVRRDDRWVCAAHTESLRGEVGDHELGTVRHDERNAVALSDTERDEHGREPFSRFEEIAVRKVSPEERERGSLRMRGRGLLEE